MAASFEKSVKGATKQKCAAPKAKYVEHILIATHAGEAGIAEVFRALQIRLRESGWTTVFKALIVVHYMIREGEREVTLRYLRRNPRIIALTHYSDAQIQGRNIRNYSFYLNERARTYGDVRTDYVRSGEGRLRKMSVEKGLLREVECVQVQLRALLKCEFMDSDFDNEITLLAFRLLVSDLLVLFHVVNEGVINVLEHYFEMSRYDAERALEIYKVFTKQTADIVEFLQQARSVEPSTRLQIPNIKHAPTSLTSSLEEYLYDPDFDVNRRQYLAQQEAKKNGGKAPKAVTSGKTSPAQTGPTPATTASEPAKAQPKIAPDLIDFFESIESDQTPLFGNQNNQQQPQPVAVTQAAFQQPAPALGFNGQPQIAPVASQELPAQTGGFAMGFTQQQPPQQMSPFPQAQLPQELSVQPVQTHFTGAGFGGYTPQDQTAVSAPPIPMIPQQFMAPTTQPQLPQQQLPQTTMTPALQIPAATGAAAAATTNPFRASMMMQSPPNLAASPPSSAPPKSTNPFARGAASTTTSPSSTLSPATPQQSQTGLSRSTTNPFARQVSPQATGAPGNLGVPGAGGGAATNPFRASMMMQQQQAQQLAQMNGNFSGQTGTMGGWENMETIPVFPRPQQ